MTLDAAEFQQVTEIAARVAAEQIRNLGRGTGGANMPIPITRPGTVAGDADAGEEVSVRADGDANAVPAVNAAGLALNAGERVLVSWLPPLGVYVTHVLDRSQRGLWTPTWLGPSAVSTGVTTDGTYYRVGDLVHVRAKMTFGVGTAAGTGLLMGNLPWPVKTHGDTLHAHGLGHAWDSSASTRYPLAWIVSDGQTSGPLQAWGLFAAPGFPRYNDVNASTPMTWATADEVNITLTYETDAP